ncbi:MAG: 2-oxoglutarate dehydrogenase E1 component [Burkholderiales bacterium]|nr:2-oxoglutarate dehydrogenase E1 component [Burkholderiales bacterium]
MNSNMQEKWNNSYLYTSNSGFIEELYELYLENPSKVSSNWKDYFDSIQIKGIKDINHNTIKEKIAYITQMPLEHNVSFEINDAQTKVWKLVNAYRIYGMAYADLDPLQRRAKTIPPELNITNYQLNDELENEFYVDLDVTSAKKMKLKEIIRQFDLIYCEKAAFEFGHISNLSERDWLTKYIETNYLKFKLSDTEKIKILQKLTEADVFERYLHTKYVGQKRFSLEGGDSLIPALDILISAGAKSGIKEAYIGMAHRGRINCLVNIAGKPPHKVFAEFEGHYPKYDFVTTGDVKYHKGFRCNYATANGVVKTEIAYNPSHLEVVNPVLNGIVRARQDKLNNQNDVLGILIHGDSALIGLGTNQGVLNMSLTRAYNVKGMVHIVVNNQIGFTTSDTRDSRSSRYCTDIAKMIESPIIHVNGDDVEAVAFVMQLAIDYRLKYKKDIMIDIVCFRRHGHNEADDPSLTQPFMYSLIKQHPATRILYAKELVTQGVITEQVVEQLANNYRDSLAQGIHPNADKMVPIAHQEDLDYATIIKANCDDKVNTKIDNKMVQLIAKTVTTLPNDKFKPHPTVVRLLENRRAMGAGEIPVDYGMAEMLAYGSLLEQGYSVRLTGEDSCRGTFTHRHAVLHNLDRKDVNDGGYMPLEKLVKAKNRLAIYDSVLNEECVLGFEYGYSITNVKELVIWEAQFGDFANGAQVIIDQFIASGETKWGVLSNLTMLLPHGFDGQGPEHSSARIERFLQLGAENNMMLVIPTTAAQVFHILRYKPMTNWIKPLIIFMSKKLLRFKDATSSLDKITAGSFLPVIGDDKQPLSATKIIICAGQIYYDLFNERAQRKLEQEVALIRLERLYPFPEAQLKQEISQYTKVKNFLWVQEEPYNQGCWLQLRENLDKVLDRKANFSAITRPASAAPACGYASTHSAELKNLLDGAFA